MIAKHKGKLVIVFAFAIGFASAFPVADTTNKIVKKQQTEWSVADSKAYAYDQLLEWQHKQYRCLTQLWGKESAWNPKAFNETKVMGKNAGGIPQILGLDPNMPATRQIDRGLSYIYHRYGTPCKAWVHFKEKGWH